MKTTCSSPVRRSLAIIWLISVMMCTYLWSSAQCITLTDSIVNPPCSGYNNGQVTLNASNGTLPYTYKKGINGTPQSSNVFGSLSPGSYKFYVSDAAGCTDSITAAIIPGYPHIQISYVDLGAGHYLFTGLPSGLTSPNLLWGCNSTNLLSGDSVTFTLSPGRNVIDVVGQDSLNSCISNDSVIINTTGYAGVDRTICQSGSLNMAAMGDGNWSAAAGNPGSATIFAPPSLTTYINGFTVAGTYSFIWTGPGGSDTVQVFALARPNAGSDRTIGINSNTFMGATGTGTWTAMTTNPVTTTIVNTTSPNTTITGFTATGTYNYIWTNASGCTDTAAVIVNPVSAGPDQHSCTGLTVTMAANTSTGTWTSLASNPVATTINTPSSPTTTISGFTVTGVYDYVWTSFSVSDTMRVTVTLTPAPPVVALFGTCDSLIAHGAAGADSIIWWYTGWPIPVAVRATDSIYHALGSPHAYTAQIALANGCRSGYSDTVTTVRCPGAGPDRTVSCATLPGGSAMMSAGGTGTWSVLPGAPGSVSVSSVTDPNAVFSNFSNAGTYALAWTTSGLTDTALIVVTARADAGPDVTAVGGTATMAATGTGIWTVQAGNPGSANIAIPTSPTTTITGFSASGIYHYIWNSSSGCKDTAAVTVNLITCSIILTDTITSPGCQYNSGIVNLGVSGGTAPYQYRNGINGNWQSSHTFTGLTAGTDTFYTKDVNNCSQSIIATIIRSSSYPTVAPTSNSPVPLGGTITLVSHATGNITSYSWTGPNGFTSVGTNPTISNATAGASGVYSVTVVNTNGCNANGLVTVVVGTGGAGPDQTLSCVVFPGGSVTMGGLGTGTWSASAGNPGTSSITSPTSPTTTITTFSAAGTYSYFWTNGTQIDTALVTVSGRSNAGPDRTVSCASLTGGSAAMAAVGTGTWSAAAGNPGTATIMAPSSPTTAIANFTAAGVYNFLWNSGSGCPDTAQVTVTAKPNAGADRTATTGGSATMAATGTGTWTAQAGNPGTATITSPSSPTTTITSFSIAGTYRFIWTNASGCSDTAAVVVTNTNGIAGPDQLVPCAVLPGGSATMAATGTGTWTAASGNPGTATITSPSSATTAITTYSAAGVYTFIWTSGSQIDTALVTVTVKPNAGPNRAASCLPPSNAVATMAATGTGTWSAMSGNPGTSVITNPSSPTATITTFSATGQYSFIWSNSTGCSDTVVVSVWGQANAGPDKTATVGGSATMAAVGSGSWQALAGNPGTATITNFTSATTSITGFTVAGTYHFYWLSGGCGDTADVIVTGSNAGPDQAVCDSTRIFMNALGTGTWTALSTNPSTTTILVPFDPRASVTGLNATGVYGFVWQASSGHRDTMHVTVSVCACHLTGSISTAQGPDSALLTATVSGGYGPYYHYDWSQYIPNNYNGPNAIVRNNGIYKVTITDLTSGCSLVLSDTVSSLPCSVQDTLTVTDLGGNLYHLAAGYSGAAHPIFTWIVTSGGQGTYTTSVPYIDLTLNNSQYAWGIILNVQDSGTTCSYADSVGFSLGAMGLAGADQSIYCVAPPGGNTTLVGYGSNYGFWTALPGNPGSVTMVSPTSAYCGLINFTALGTYSFTWTTSYGIDTMSVFVHGPISAGPDRAASVGGSVTMMATGVGRWTASSTNPGTASIHNNTDSITIISGFSAAGTYYYYWSNTAGCSDTVAIIVGSGIAGPDQVLSCASLPGGSVTMAATTGTGTWTTMTGNPGTSIITTPSSPATTITNFSVAGTYHFIWTNGSQADTAVVTVTARPDAGPDRSISCVALPGGTVTMAATGTGTWTALTGNPGTATITNPTNPGTTITAFSANGIYSFVWTNSTGCKDTATVTVNGANGGPNRAATCAPIPGGVASMLATGTGTWTAMTGNPGTAIITNPFSPTTTITTFSATGQYAFIWSSGTGCADTVVVSVWGQPDAGPDKTAILFGSATMSGTTAMAGTWHARPGNPGSASITTPTSPTTTITNFSAAGVYTFILENSGGCADTALIVVSPVSSSAGPDQHVCIGATVAAMSTGTGTWTALPSNPASTTITSPSSNFTTILGFSTLGTYGFVWSADTMYVTVSPTPTTPVLTQTDSCLGMGSIIAHGAVAGDSIIWIKTGSTSTQITAAWDSFYYALSAGSYTAQIRSASGCLSAYSDTVTVIACPCNLTGQMIVIHHPNNETLIASVTNGSQNYTYAWSCYLSNQSGNQYVQTITASNNGIYEVTVTDMITGCQVVISDTVTGLPCSVQDTASYTYLGNSRYHISGTYSGASHPIFSWLVDGGYTWLSTSVPYFDTTFAPGVHGIIFHVRDSGTTCYFEDSISISIAAGIAGPDRNLSCIVLPGGSVTMAALGNGNWSAQAGNPGTVTITNSSNPSTTITNFSAAGTYRFIWTSGSLTDTALVTVTGGGVNAGPDRATVVGGSSTMAATGTGTWAAQAGNPGTATITTPTSPTTTITNFSTAGIYYFIWTGGSGCSDVAAIVVSGSNGIAGPDQAQSCVSLPGGFVHMHATGAGIWTAASGNPGTATIITPTDSNTGIDNFSAAGVYTFIWTVGSQSDIALVTITSADGGPDQSLGCFVLPGGSATMAATGSGTWSPLPGNPGTATITTPSDPHTTITGFTAPGIHKFAWTTTTGCIDTVILNFGEILPTPQLSATGTCLGTDTLIAHGSGSALNIIWQLSGGTIHSSLASDTTYMPATGGNYTIKLFSPSGCLSPASNPITFGACLSDSVWPGDADHNGLADNNDLLPIGTAYGLNGFTRPDQSIVWSAHYAQDWGMQFLNGTNAKHADCNGDALIDANDTTAIMQNFGLTHSKTDGYGAPWRSGTPGITLQFSKDTVVQGDTMTVSLILGDSLIPASNIYGLAFTYHFDPIVVDTTTCSFAFINSFLGNSATKISIHKDFNAVGRIMAAVTGINHLNRTGYGKIAHFIGTITTGNINGKDLSYYNDVNYISDITALDKDGYPITLNAGTDSNKVAYEPDGIRDIDYEHVSIYPNPAKDAFIISANSRLINTGYTISDVTGRLVLSGKLKGEQTHVSINDLASGVYMLQLGERKICYKVIKN